MKFAVFTHSWKGGADTIIIVLDYGLGDLFINSNQATKQDWYLLDVTLHGLLAIY